MTRRRALLLAVLVVLLAAGLVAGREIAAWGIVRPFRKVLTADAPPDAQKITARRGDVTLEGWLLRTSQPRHLPVVFLHGIADNRASGLGIARRLREAGHDVLLLDARGHGASGGMFCTFGVEESPDLSAMLDAAKLTRVAAIGYSLGGAIALQAAARDPRIAGVATLAVFSDLRSVVTDRAPLPLRGPFVDLALRRAAVVASFDPSAASPVRAAERLTVPVLLIHGADDRATPADHSRRIDAVLHAPHRLLIVPGFGHDGLLGAPGVKDEMERWLAGLE